MIKIVSIISWPNSQLCMDCVNGEFVQSETYNQSNYLCSVACMGNNGVLCPKLLLKKEIKNSEGGDKCPT